MLKVVALVAFVGLVAAANGPSAAWTKNAGIACNNRNELPTQKGITIETAKAYCKSESTCVSFEANPTTGRFHYLDHLHLRDQAGNRAEVLPHPPPHGLRGGTNPAGGGPGGPTSWPLGHLVVWWRASPTHWGWLFCLLHVHLALLGGAGLCVYRLVASG
jgi:hypothetical protein